MLKHYIDDVNIFPRTQTKRVGQHVSIRYRLNRFLNTENVVVMWYLNDRDISNDILYEKLTGNYRRSARKELYEASVKINRVRKEDAGSYRLWAVYNNDDEKVFYSTTAESILIVEGMIVAF